MSTGKGAPNCGASKGKSQTPIHSQPSVACERFFDGFVDVPYYIRRDGLTGAEDKTDRVIVNEWIMHAITAFCGDNGLTVRQQLTIHGIIRALNSSDEEGVLLSQSEYEFIRNAFYEVRFPVAVNAFICQLYAKFNIDV